MIANDEQLRVVQQQIARLETALRSLAVAVRPHSEQQFQAFAEEYAEQLRQLRRDVDDYVGIDAATPGPAAQPVGT